MNTAHPGYADVIELVADLQEQVSELQEQRASNSLPAAANQQKEKWSPCDRSEAAYFGSFDEKQNYR